MWSKGFLVVVCFLSFWPQSQDTVIAWSDEFKLSWNQFKGKPNPAVDAAAVTASGITFEFSIKEAETKVLDFSTKVEAHFYPDKSWYLKERVNSHILAHEQLHFDLTELYARKFRMLIEQLKVNNNIKLQLQTLHESINKDLAETQKRYDAETDSSRNFEAQAKWDAFIKKELKTYESYKSKS